MITAVVITRNEEKNIARTLGSLTDIRISVVIVSDSNSSDKTEEIVKKFAVKDGRIIFSSYKTPPFTAARGRNEGAHLADINNKFLLFIDGDMEFIPRFLDTAINVLEKNLCISAISGQMHNFYYDDSGRITKKDFNYYHIQDEKPGGAVLFRMADFQSLCGYNEDLVVNEEAELFYRLKKIGRQFRRIDELMVIHHTEMPTSNSRIRERIFDKKITALSKNFILGIRDIKYMKVLIKDNKYTITSAAAIALSLSIFLAWPWLSFCITGACYLFTSLRCQSFRVGLNYLIYGFGLLLGLLGYLLRRSIARRVDNE